MPYALKNNNELRVGYVLQVGSEGKKKERRRLALAALSDGRGKDITVNSVSNFRVVVEDGDRIFV